MHGFHLFFFQICFAYLTENKKNGHTKNSYLILSYLFLFLKSTYVHTVHTIWFDNLYFFIVVIPYSAGWINQDRKKVENLRVGKVE